MKKGLIILFAVLGFAGIGNAHMAGLPIAGGAVVLAPEAMRASGGLIIGDDLNLYGARFCYGLVDDLEVFGDFGFIDPDGGDMGWGFQAGGLYSLARVIPDLPFDLAARGTLGYTSFDQEYPDAVWNPRTGWTTRNVTHDISIITLNVGAVASKDVEMLTVYGYLGLNYTRISNGDSDSETDPAIGAGVLFNINEQFSVYGELMHIDDLWIGAGVRYRF